ncbi:MAG: hypothetical protein AB7P04_12860 [Bacteriovoracia bacterium]
MLRSIVLAGLALLPVSAFANPVFLNCNIGATVNESNPHFPNGNSSRFGKSFVVEANGTVRKDFYVGEQVYHLNAEINPATLAADASMRLLAFNKLNDQYTYVAPSDGQRAYGLRVGRVNKNEMGMLLEAYYADCKVSSVSAYPVE